MDKHLKLLLILLFLSVTKLDAQQSNNDNKNSLIIKTESAGTFTTGDNAPFWITNNKYGIGWHNTNNQHIRAGIFLNQKLFNKELTISTEGDIVVANQLESDFFIQQLYLDLKYKKIELSVGQKEKKMLFRNNDLSTGSMVLSNNARPLPQVGISTQEFIPIPFTKKTLSFMGGVSYGWYTDNSYREKTEDDIYVKNVLSHHKYLFLKFEKTDSPWNLIAGIEGGAQWGGDTYIDGEYSFTHPHAFSDMMRILFNRSGGRDAQEGQQINKLGDSYGSYHLIFNYKLENESQLKLYYEHFFEDRSGMEYMNFPDGTYGIEYNFNKKQLVSTILFEYLYSKSQSGPVEYDENGNWTHISTGDNYYNNGSYRSNQHYGFVLGNPLLTSPLYNQRSLRIPNNRLISFHLGAQGWFNNKLSYKTLITHSRGYGTPLIKFDKPRNEFMSSFELTYSNPKWDGWSFSGAVAYDKSDSFIGDNLGVQMKIAKTFGIK